MDVYCKISGPVDITKQMTFLLFWLSKYMFLNPTLKVPRDYACLAFDLARGKVALGSLVLVVLYKSITHAFLSMVSKEERVLSGPL